MRKKRWNNAKNRINDIGEKLCEMGENEGRMVKVDV
jgi:hypothetical protein